MAKPDKPASTPRVWGVPYAATLLVDTGSMTWVEVVREGSFYGNTGSRQVEFSASDIRALAENWNVTEKEQWFTGGAPVGYNHASALGSLEPEATKAAARIRQVAVRQNDEGGLSLWAQLDWTTEGAERVSDGEFAAVSAELLPPSVATSKLTGEPIGGWTLVGATLTNTPFVPGMTAPVAPGMVAASEVMYLTENEPVERESMSSILVALTETVGVGEAELLTEIARLKAEAAKVSTLSEALTTATSDLEVLRERNAGLEENEKTRVLDEACALGRIAPTERDEYWALIGVTGTERANALFSEGRLPVDKDGSVASDEAIKGADADLNFLSLVDAKMSEGLSEADAWNVARTALGSTIYTTASIEEN